MKRIPRIALGAVLLALLGLSGCIVDPGYWGHEGRGRGGESGRRGDDHDRRDLDCRRGSDDGRCRESGPTSR